MQLIDFLADKKVISSNARKNLAIVHSYQKCLERANDCQFIADFELLKKAVKFKKIQIFELQSNYKKVIIDNWLYHKLKDDRNVQIKDN